MAACGLVAFLVTLAGSLPASVALDWLTPDTVRFNGIAGTIWRGSALSVGVGGARLGETSWRLFPPALLLGRLAGHVRTSLGDGNAEGDLSIAVTGSVACNSCRYQGRLRSLQALVPALTALDGRAEIQIETIEFRDAWPSRIVGVANVLDVPLGPTGEAQTGSDLAAFVASVDSDPIEDDGRIEATVADIGGPVEVNGRLVVVPSGSFTFTGRAKSRPGAPPGVVSALGVLGPRTSDGSTELSFSGSL